MTDKEKDKSFQKLEERTLVVRNFNPTLTTKQLLEELFSNFGPVNNVIMKNDHAFIDFSEPESVGYALAMMWRICLHGKRLNLSPKISSNSYYHYLELLRSFERKCDNDENFLKQFLSPKQHDEHNRIIDKYKNSKKDRQQIHERLNKYRRHFVPDSYYNPYFGKELFDDNYYYYYNNDDNNDNQQNNNNNYRYDTRYSSYDQLQYSQQQQQPSSSSSSIQKSYSFSGHHQNYYHQNESFHHHHHYNSNNDIMFQQQQQHMSYYQSPPPPQSYNDNRFNNYLSHHQSSSSYYHHQQQHHHLYNKNNKNNNDRRRYRR